MNKAKAVYNSGILFSTTTLTGLNFEVDTRADWRLSNPLTTKLSVPDLHDMAADLISAARASGQVIEIENVSVPEYGMGGYAPAVKLRPSYEKVREAMDELQARKNGTSVPPTTLKFNPHYVPQPLKARLIPWVGSDEEINTAVQQDPRHLPHKTLVKLVREYDRRLMQMWDKVGFERENNLVDYSALNTGNPDFDGELISSTPIESKDLSKGVDDFTTNCRDWFISVFQSRYDCVFAFAAFSTELDIKVRDMAEGDFESEFMLLEDLVRLDYFPLASGETFTEAVQKLDEKLKRVPLMSPGKDYASWLRYVGDLNTRSIKCGVPVDVPLFRQFKLSDNDAPAV